MQRLLLSANYRLMPMLSAGYATRETVMPQFVVDGDLPALVEKLAKPEPFENLLFNNALRKVLTEYVPHQESPPRAKLEDLIARAKEVASRAPKKAPTPSASAWAQDVPELRSRRELINWIAICKHLKIDPAGDSARRKLAGWVQVNRSTSE
jgi:hypothetical protein